MTPPTPAAPLYPDPVALHRRQFRRRVLLPVALGLLLIVAAAGLPLVALRGRDVSLVADWMFACLCLLPVLIILFPVYLALVLAAFTIGRADRLTTRQMRRARQGTEEVAARARQIGEELGRRSIEVAARAAALDRLFNVFNQPPTGEVKNHGAKQTDGKSQ